MNKLNDILESEEYRQWLEKVKLHDMYDKHNYQSKEYTTICSSCGHITELIKDNIEKEVPPDIIKNILFNTINLLIAGEEDVILKQALSIIFNHNVEIEILAEIVNQFVEKQTSRSNYFDGTDWLWYIPYELMEEIIKRKKLTLKSFNKIMQTLYGLPMLKQYYGKFMLLEWPKKIRVNDMKDTYDIASIVKKGALQIKNNLKFNIFKPLPLLIKDKKQAQSFLTSKSSLLGAKLWLVWNFPEWYYEVKSLNIPYAKEIDTLLWYYKYKKNYKEYYKSEPQRMLTEEEANGIVNGDAKTVFEINKQLDAQASTAILLKLSLKQFYELSDREGDNYLKYKVDKYGNLIRMDKIVFPNIAGQARKEG